MCVCAVCALNKAVTFSYCGRCHAWNKNKLLASAKYAHANGIKKNDMFVSHYYGSGRDRGGCANITAQHQRMEIN